MSCYYSMASYSATALINIEKNKNRVKNPNVLAFCNICACKKPETNFNLKRVNDKGLRTTCIECDAFPKHLRDCKHRGIENSLTKEEYYSLIHQPCVYCNGVSWTNPEFEKNGIDRFDNDVGYHIWNCVPCCYRCNVFKSNHSQSFLTRFSTNYLAVSTKYNQDRLKASQHSSEQSSDMTSSGSSPCTYPPEANTI